MTINPKTREIICKRYPHLSHITDDKTFAFNATSLAAVEGVSASEYWTLARIASGRSSDIISLTDYAIRQGKDPSGVRRKAEQGGFVTARKIGRNWVIDSDEPFVDRRMTMKSWKDDVVDAMKATGLREISLFDVARSLGINHIKTQDASDILRAFVKRNPTYRIVKMVNNTASTDSTESLFTTGTVTELDYSAE